MSTVLHPLFVFHLLFSSLNGLQVFHTNSMDEYRNGIISCDNSEDCAIICDYTNGCKNTQINCPISKSCDVTCSAAKSCENAIVVATHSSSLTIHDCNSGSLACNGLSIYLPPNNNGIARAMIDGSDGDLSQAAGPNVTFIEEESEEESLMNLYAIYGWNDIEIINYSDSLKSQTGIMHCTVGYEVSCPFSDNTWLCQDIHHFCNNPQTTHPTTTAALSSAESVSYMADESERITTLWYGVYGLIMCIVFVICTSTLCVVRSYVIEKELMDACDEANDELIRLCKMYNSDMYSRLTPTKEMISTPESIETMISVDDDDEDEDEDDTEFTYISDEDDEEGDTVSKLSHIPAGKSMIVNLKKNYSHSYASTITKTVSASLKNMVLNKNDSQISANSSMLSIFHELNNDNQEFGVDTQSEPTLKSTDSFDTIITLPNDNHIFNKAHSLSILNDENEHDHEFVD